MARRRRERRLRTFGPAHRPAHRLGRLGFGGGIRDALVEHHRDGGAEKTLHLDRAFGGKQVAAAVDVRLEGDALLVDRAQLGERHHLVAARIGQHRTRPVHEAAQAAEPGDALGAGPEHQVVGVAEHDLGSRGGERLGRHSLHRRRGAHRHEGGRLDRPVRGLEPPRARGAARRLDGEGEWPRFAHAAARWIRLPSPYE